MQDILNKLGLDRRKIAGVFYGEWRGGGKVLDKHLAHRRQVAGARSARLGRGLRKAIGRAQEAFLKWRITPGPVRGETVRQLGNALREAKPDLGSSSRSNRARSSPKAKAKCRR